MVFWLQQRSVFYTRRNSSWEEMPRSVCTSLRGGPRENLYSSVRVRSNVAPSITAWRIGGQAVV